MDLNLFLIFIIKDGYIRSYLFSYFTFSTMIYWFLKFGLTDNSVFYFYRNQIVTLETHNNQKARIIGITSDFGSLKASTINDDNDNLEEIITLQPDGNSFDMMKGMISRKS